MSKKPTKLLHHATTGEIVEIELTEAEIEQRRKDNAEFEAAELAATAQQQAHEQARQKALINRFSDEDVPKGKDWKELVLKLNARVEYLEKLLGVE